MAIHSISFAFHGFQAEGFVGIVKLTGAAGVGSDGGANEGAVFPLHADFKVATGA